MHVFSTQEVGAIAGQVDPEVSFQVGDNFNLSASEVFYVINKFLAGMVQRQGTETLLLERTPYGPASASGATHREAGRALGAGGAHRVGCPGRPG